MPTVQPHWDISKALIHVIRLFHDLVRNGCQKGTVAIAVVFPDKRRRLAAYAMMTVQVAMLSL
ncbi:hypothetical protein RHEC894_PA00017 (plasmid) [Rhizobium sp. CIAT894]|nr:hypothetical protein RHEC894_PA00017 [Rhizobium sp. CIAT894]